MIKCSDKDNFFLDYTWEEWEHTDEKNGNATKYIEILSKIVFG